MKVFGTRTRGGISALLSAALIMGGAMLAAPAAYAEEPAGEVATVEGPPAGSPIEVPVEQASVEAPPADPAPEASEAEVPLSLIHI